MAASPWRRRKMPHFWVAKRPARRRAELHRRHRPPRPAAVGQGQGGGGGGGDRRVQDARGSPVDGPRASRRRRRGAPPPRRRAPPRRPRPRRRWRRRGVSPPGGEGGGEQHRCAAGRTPTLAAHPRTLYSDDARLGTIPADWGINRTPFIRRGSSRTTGAMRVGGAGVVVGWRHRRGCGRRSPPPVGTAAPSASSLQPFPSNEGDWRGNPQV